MLKGFFLFLAILSTLTILFFDTFEEKLIDMDFSWTLSKSLPYVILIFLGILLSSSIRKQIKIRNKFLKTSLLFIFFLAPFTIGFILHPIYEGDFSLQGKEIRNAPKSKIPSNTDLMVIAIPGCPFCMGSIAKLKKIKKRNPNLSITFIVCSKDTLTLSEYKSEIGNSFNIQLADDIEQMINMANTKFPSFIKIENGQATYSWSNDQFGVRAIDDLESHFRGQN